MVSILSCIAFKNKQTNQALQSQTWKFNAVANGYASRTSACLCTEALNELNSNTNKQTKSRSLHPEDLVRLSFKRDETSNFVLPFAPRLTLTRNQGFVVLCCLATERYRCFFYSGKEGTAETVYSAENAHCPSKTKAISGACCN